MASTSEITKTTRETLNAVLACPLCSSLMSSPRSLPCAHTFCRLCLIDYAEKQIRSTSRSSNSILCPTCKIQIDFRSLEHFESILIVNPILKKLCDALSESKSNSDSSTSQAATAFRARCHACFAIELLKICKHCHFMICGSCRRAHLLEVHHESKIRQNVLESHLRIVHEKLLQMEYFAQNHDKMKKHIADYVQRLINEVYRQRCDALEILDSQQTICEEEFWSENGFDNEDKLEFFISLLIDGQRKLSSTNITDRELMELFDNLQTIPDTDEKQIESIYFPSFSLQLDENILNMNFIRVYDNENNVSSNADILKTVTSENNEQTDSIQA